MLRLDFDLKRDVRLPCRQNRHPVRKSLRGEPRVEAVQPRQTIAVMNLDCSVIRAKFDQNDVGDLVVCCLDRTHLIDAIAGVVPLEVVTTEASEVTTES